MMLYKTVYHLGIEIPQSGLVDTPASNYLIPIATSDIYTQYRPAYNHNQFVYLSSFFPSAIKI